MPQAAVVLLEVEDELPDDVVEEVLLDEVPEEDLVSDEVEELASDLAGSEVLPFERLSLR